MPYITYDEFKQMSSKDVSKEDFDALIKKASPILDNITGHFFRRNNIEKINEWIVNQFKLGLVSQIEYFYDIGASSSHELNSPMTINVGRTQIGVGMQNQREVNRLVAEEVYICLEGTGLLYMGVDSI